MNLALIYIALVSLILVLWHFHSKRMKGEEETEEKRAIELLRKARIMFPGQTDIEALDSLYRHTFREMLLAMKTDDPGWQKLKEESILVFNAKNRAIIESVRFEERFINPLIKKQSIPISN